MADRFFMPYQFWQDTNGRPLRGGKLFFYATGTTTPKATYNNPGLTIANANPVVADANGRWPSIFLASGDYKVVLQTSAGVTVWTADPVAGSIPGDIVSNVSGALTNCQMGRWWVILARGGASTLVAASLRESLADGATTGFDPATGVAFTAPDDQTLRVTVTGGALVGSGGSNVQCRCVAARVGNMAFGTTPTLTTVRI